MENQQQVIIQSPKKGAGWGTIIFIFLTQSVLIFIISILLSFSFSTFNGSSPSPASVAALPILIIFLLLGFSIKNYIDFRHGKNNYGLTGLILSIIPPILILFMV